MSHDDLRQLDAEVHRRVMGRPVRFVKMDFGPDTVPTPQDGETGDVVPRYSSDLAACGPVLQWLRDRWGQLTIVAGLAWHVFPDDASKGREWGAGDTLPEAVCRAALLEAGR